MGIVLRIQLVWIGQHIAYDLPLSIMANGVWGGSLLIGFSEDGTHPMNMPAESCGVLHSSMWIRDRIDPSPSLSFRVRGKAEVMQCRIGKAVALPACRLLISALVTDYTSGQIDVQNVVWERRR